VQHASRLWLAVACVLAVLSGTVASLRALASLTARASSSAPIHVSAPEFVAPGGLMRWRVAMTNTTAVTAAGQLSAFVPTPFEQPVAPGATVVPAAGGFVVAWEDAALGPGATFGGEAEAHVPAGTTTPLSRTLAATATLAGAPPTGANAGHVVRIVRSDVRLELGSEAIDVRPSELLTHGLAIDNLARSAAEGAVVTLTLDARTAFVSDTLDQSDVPWAPGAVSRTTGAGFVSWRLPPLAGPRRVAFQVVTRVADDAPAGAGVVHSAAFGATTLDASLLDDVATAMAVPIVVPDLWIEKTGTSEVEAGGVVEYAITWGNAGGRARDVVITDVLPAGTVWISSTPTAEILDSGHARWMRGTAPTTGGDPLEVIRVWLAVDEAAGSGAALTNRVEVASNTSDAEPSDDRASATSFVAGSGAPVADLQVAVVGPGDIAPGGRVTYAFSVTNAGPEVAAGAVLTATLPAMMAEPDASDAGQVAGTRIVWLFGTLAPGATGSAVATSTLAADTPVDVSGTLRVAASSAAPPGATADDVIERTIRVAPTDVRVAIGPVGPAVPGAEVVHAITVTNAALAAADDLAVTVRLAPTLQDPTDDLEAQPGAGPFAREALPDGVRWTLTRLAGGASLAWVVRSELDLSVPEGAPVTATVSALAATRDASTLDDAMAVSQPAAASPVASLSIEAPASLPVGGATAPVTVTLRDGTGQLVPNGTRVGLSTSAGSLAHAEVASEGGKAVTVLTTGTVAQAVTITAFAGRQATATVAFVPGPPAEIAVSLSPAIADVGDVGTVVRLAARDAFGNAVADGTPFSASANGGLLSRELGTTVGGAAEVGWTSRRTGTDMITVRIGAVERSASMTWLAGPPERLAVYATPDEVPVESGRSRIEAIAYDAFGNRVMSGYRAAFAASLGSIVPASAELTDGVAAATWSAPSTHGMAAIDATMERLEGEPISAMALVRARSVDLTLASSLETARGPAATAQMFPGDEVSYTLAVANQGLIAADGVVLQVELPGEMLLERVTASDDIFQRDPGGEDMVQMGRAATLPFAWDLPDLSPGAGVTVTLAGPVARDRPWTGSDSLYFRAAVTTTSDSEALGPLRVSDLTRVVAGDLFIGLRLDESASQIRPGGELAYDVFLGNDQAQTQVEGARITDTLPAWTTLDHWQAGTGLAVREAQPFGADDREVVWAIDGPVPSSGSLRVWLGIDADAPPQTLLVNTVAIGSSVFDVASGNDDAVDSGAWIAGVDLVSELTGPRALVPGTTGRFEAAVLNGARRDRATGVAIAVDLPAGMTVLQAPPDAVVAPGRVTWPVGSLGAGARKRFPLDLAAPPSAVPGTRIVLRASVSGDVPDSAPINDRSELGVLMAEAGSTDPAAISVRSVPGPSGACPPEPERIIASVVDGNGLQVADGAMVRFSTTRGTLSAPITTTVEGEAHVQLSFGGPGRADVTASVGDLAASASVTGTSGAPDVFALSAATTAPAVRSRVPLTVEARDRCGRLVADGWPVTLTAERGRFVGGGASIVLQTVEGRVTAVLEVGAVPGPLRVTAEHGARRATRDLDVRGAFEPTATPRPGGNAIYLPSVRRPR